MKTDWKSRLKTVLADKKNLEVSTNSILPKTDETKSDLLLSVFDSVNLVDTSKTFEKKRTLPRCSNCNLEMILIENSALWFCPFGCESRKAENAPVSFADFYNAKLEKVLNDEKLFEDFETILDEQKAVLMINGELSESEAESRINNLSNFREIVLSV